MSSTSTPSTSTARTSPRPRTLVPYLAVTGGVAALDFYARAFGAIETSRMLADDGRVAHSEMTIGGAPVYLSDEWPELEVRSPCTLGGCSVSLVLEVDDADAFVTHLARSDVRVEREVGPGPEPGTRAGWVIDPYGHRWHVWSATG